MLKGKAPLVIALVLGFMAALIAYRTMKRHEEQVKEGWNLVPVVVANRDVQEGSSLEWDMVAEHQMPEQFVTTSVVDPKQLERVVGQKLMVPLQRGDPILWSHFRSDGSNVRLSNVVSRAMRAIGIQVGGADAVSNMVRPNDHIDILGTFADERKMGMVTVTLMQDVIVMATGQVTGNTNLSLLDDSQKDYSTLTLLVLPEQAEMLVLASRLGSLVVTLRNPEDMGYLEQRSETTLDTLLTGERTKEMQKKYRDTWGIIRGASSGGAGH